MLHTHRTWQVSDVATADELADKLTDYTWTGCTAWRLQGVLFLNDSFSEDGAQEYAVIRDGIQIDSITFSWCTRDEAFDHIRGIVETPAAEYPTWPAPDRVTPRLDEPGPFATHRCSLCM